MMIKYTMPSVLVDMGGIEVLQPLPTMRVEQIDPFLLLHHHMGEIESGSHPRHLGVGPHPHRGFSPVTFIFKGDVHHRDSRGNSSVVKAGGVQWMDAGMGIVHSERPSVEFAERGGMQEIVQLWINMPGRYKMDQPRYMAAQQSDMPRLTGFQGDVRLVAGSFEDAKGPIKSQQGVTALMGTLAAQDELSLSKLNDEHAILYVLEGSGFLKGYGLVERKTLYAFNEEAATTSLKANEELKFIYLSARPIGEKVQQYGPYVMNTQTEILEALRDYQMGKMGFLVEEF